MKIKHQVLTEISKKRKVTRKDIQKFIWNAQGKNPSEYKNRNGYYSDALVKWESEKLIKRIDKGVYVITKEGKKYVQNPKSIRQINMKVNCTKYHRMYKYYYSKYYDLYKENRRLKEELENVQNQPNIEECIEYFKQTMGNYGRDTEYYLKRIINHLNK